MMTMMMMMIRTAADERNSHVSTWVHYLRLSLEGDKDKDQTLYYIYINM